MADYSLDQIKQSIAVCGAVNTPNLDAGNYIDFLGNVAAPLIPVLESVSDEEMVGDGSSQTIRNLRNTYWQNGTWNYQGLLNNHISAILLNAWQGGAVTQTARTSPSKDWAAVMNVINATPKLLSIYRRLGGEKFLHSTMAPDTFELSQAGEADPNFQSGLRSTGHYLDADQLTAADFDEADIDPAPEYGYFKGPLTTIVATDGTYNYNWTQDGELIDLSITGNRKVDVQRRPGDTLRDVANRYSGSFARKIRNGAKPENLIKLKVDLGSDLREFKTMVLNKKLTGLTIGFNGYDKIGATSDYNEFEVKAPLSKFQMIEGETDQDFGALALTIQPLRDAVTKGYLTNRTRTGLVLI